MKRIQTLSHATLLLFSSVAALCAQQSFAEEPAKSAREQAQKNWYEKLSLRGYTQLRYNRLGRPNPNLVSEQDRSIGGNNGFILRRARLIVSGDVHERVYVYIQPDLAVTSGTSGATLHFFQLRDLYADIALDPSKEFRIRAGQSKVPYSFENLQSSQNRLALDRTDAMTSGAKDERDLGLYFYWAPDQIRKRFKHLIDSGLKGSGDYGVFALGMYNGQSANRPEANNRLHYVTRLAYPLEFSNGQFIEPSISAYTGKYQVSRTSGTTEIKDERVNAGFVIYPQPIGFQGEYTVGRGPQLNDTQNAVDRRPLHGGYLQTMFKAGNFIPFVRWQYYNGGKKYETNAPKNYVRETEFGLEWQPLPALELAGEYAFVNRTTMTAPYPNVKDELIRLQLQWNY